MKGNRFFHITYNTGTMTGSVDFISNNFKYVNSELIVEHVKKTHAISTANNVIITNIIEMEECDYIEFVRKIGEVK